MKEFKKAYRIMTYTFESSGRYTKRLWKYSIYIRPLIYFLTWSNFEKYFMIQ